MKQKSTKMIASVFFNLTAIETLLKKSEDNKKDGVIIDKIILMLRASEEALYNAMLEEGEIDTFRVEMDGLVKSLEEKAQKFGSMSKTSLAIMSAYDERRLKKIILKSEKRRGV